MHMDLKQSLGGQLDNLGRGGVYPRQATLLLPAALVLAALGFSCSYTSPATDGAAASLLNSLGVATVASAAADGGTGSSAPGVTLDSMTSAFVSGAGGRASTDWTWTSTVDGKYTVRKDASACGDGTVMTGPTDVIANVANAGPTINASDLSVGTTNFALCVYYNDADDVEQNVSATFSVTRDDTAPGAPVSTPADASSSISPKLGKITLTFTDAMDTTSTPTITVDTGGTTIPTTGTIYSWKDDKTLEIKMSWVYFPENISINWSVTAAGLQDAAGNTLGSSVARSFSTTANNASFALADSGQNLCYGITNSSSQTCPHGTYAGQDGETVHPVARSFTGPTAHATYTSDYTTKDNVTGLTWKTCVEGKEGATCGTGSFLSYTWFDAHNACAALNSMNSGAGYAGKTDWRLPSMPERMTITDNSKWYPALDSAHFPGSPGAVRASGLPPGTYPITTLPMTFTSGPALLRAPRTRPPRATCAAYPVPARPAPSPTMETAPLRTTIRA